MNTKYDSSSHCCPINTMLWICGLCLQYHLTDTRAIAFTAMRTSSHVKSSPITGLEWRRGFQKVKVLRFHDNGTGRR